MLPESQFRPNLETNDGGKIVVAIGLEKSLPIPTFMHGDSEPHSDFSVLEKSRGYPSNHQTHVRIDSDLNSGRIQTPLPETLLGPNQCAPLNLDVPFPPGSVLSFEKDSGSTRAIETETRPAILQSLRTPRPFKTAIV
jgi:hypothetical protein